MGSTDIKKLAVQNAYDGLFGSVQLELRPWNKGSGKFTWLWLISYKALVCTGLMIEFGTPLVYHTFLNFAQDKRATAFPPLTWRWPPNSVHYLESCFFYIKESVLFPSLTNQPSMSQFYYIKKKSRWRISVFLSESSHLKQSKFVLKKISK